MQNLLPLPSAAIDRYDQIVEGKRPEWQLLLQALRPRVLKRYEAYAATAPHLEKLSRDSFSHEHAEALRHCYEPTKSQEALTMELRERQEGFWRTFCAYCGINTTETTEHYLPQSEFPEYAICIHNLLPACEKCNTAKGTQWQGPGGRRVVHLYYDKLPEGLPWLVAKVELHKGEPVAEFTLQQPPGLSPALFQLLQEHYATLGLLARYRRRAPELFSEKRSEALSNGTQPRQLSSLYTEQARFLEKERGRNHWKVAALWGMAASADFLTWVSQPEPAQARSA